MRSAAIRRSALEAMQSGLSLSEVSRRTGVSRAALKEWRRTGGARATRASAANTDCMRCASAACSPSTGQAYAYLLGQYLGDGCLGAFPRGVWSLRIACGDAWPGIKEECISAIMAVHPGGKVFEVRDQGCVQVTSLWKHWICHFPQHGRGRKHERTIAFEPWQHDIVVEHRGDFSVACFIAMLAGSLTASPTATEMVSANMPIRATPLTTGRPTS